VSQPSFPAHPYMERIRSEFVVRIEGNIRARKDPNKKIPTGMVELEADSVTILNAVSSKLPFLPAEDSIQLSEEVRLKHRVLDLRYNISQHIKFAVTATTTPPHTTIKHSTPLTKLPGNLHNGSACLMRQYHALQTVASKLKSLQSSLAAHAA